MDLHGMEWMFSGILAVVFLITGSVKLFRYDVALQRFAWVKSVPRALAQVIGIAEILGAVGLILPVLTGFLPWLTPVAAAVLGLLMFMAAMFNFRRHESTDAYLSLLLLMFLALVAFFRWPLLQEFPGS
jgi:putative oxidoreductase